MVAITDLHILTPDGLLEWPLLSDYEDRLRVAFVVCYILTISTLLPLIVFFKLARIKRSPVILTLFFALCFNALTSLLLASAPKHPNRALCLISSAGTISGTTFVTVADMNTVLLIWGMLRRANGKKIWLNKYFDDILLWSPWVIYIVFFTMNLVYLILKPKMLYVSTMTCFADNIVTKFSHGVAGAFLVVALAFDLWSVIMLIRHRRRVAKTTAAERELSDRSYNPVSVVNLPIVSRVLLYSLSTLGGLIVAIVLFVRPDSHVPAVYQASCGVSCFLIFGFQKDIRLKISKFLHLPPRSEATSLSLSSDSMVTKVQEGNEREDVELGHCALVDLKLNDLSNYITTVPMNTISPGSEPKSITSSVFTVKLSAFDEDEDEEKKSGLIIETPVQSVRTISRSMEQVEEGFVPCLVVDGTVQQRVELTIFPADLMEPVVGLSESEVVATEPQVEESELLAGVDTLKY